MIGANLKKLRQDKKYTLEQLAEKLGVSRQSIEKWENDESIPDIERCHELASIYHITLDELVYGDGEVTRTDEKHEGQYIFGVVKVGERGQIVIPKKAREVFQIEPGDSMVLLGDVNQGMALVKVDTLGDVWKK